MKYKKTVKIFIYALILFFIAANSFAQQNIGIGTNSPHASAALDVSSTNKGFLLPLLSQSARLAITSPANGLLVYDTTSNRFYLYQGGSWRYIVNSDLWTASTTRNYVVNSTDSVGIGTSQPQHRLDVNGDIHATDDVRVGTSISSSGTATGSFVNASGNISGGGTATVTGNLVGSSDVVIDNESAILQLKVNSVNKGFFQLSGDDLRMGTNSGNANGVMVIRMNGENVWEADSTSGISLLKPGPGVDPGRLVIGTKIARGSNGNNLLPILYGQVQSDGYSPSMWPSSGRATRISLGVYEIDTRMDGVSDKGVIVLTPVGSIPRVCIGRYTGNGVFRVEIFNMAGSRVDADFYFMINDPLN